MAGIQFTGREVIRRGHLVLVALPGDYGKPRPALVVQADIGADLPSVVLCPLTTTIRPTEVQFRLTIEPSPQNGLPVHSQVMIEKPVSISRSKVHGPIGSVDDNAMNTVGRALALLLGIA